jgi:hypothetical protein
MAAAVIASMGCNCTGEVSTDINETKSKSEEATGVLEYT